MTRGGLGAGDWRRGSGALGGSGSLAKLVSDLGSMLFREIGHLPN